MVLLCVSSPHWLVSWQDTYSPFKNMGLWEFCFSRFRYPNYQFDDLFDGCHYVFSKTYFVIWEWLLPGKMKYNIFIDQTPKACSLFSKGWLMAVQAFMTLALIFSCSAHIASTMLLVRWPLNFSFRYHWQILSMCCIMNGLKTFCLFLSVAVFGGQCWRRDWMLYPNFNYLSWSYAFAVIAMLIGMGATACFYFVSGLHHTFYSSSNLSRLTILKDAKRTMERKKQNSNLVVQMQPTHGSQIYI